MLIVKVFTKIRDAGCYGFLAISMFRFCHKIYRYWIDCKKSRKECLEQQEMEQQLGPALWNTVLFFPDDNPKAPDSANNKLIWYLSQAKTSIKFCMFLFNSPQLKKTLQDIRSQKGVDIKGVVGTQCQWGPKLNKLGMGTKIWKQKYFHPTRQQYEDLMHHKFVIIDDMYLLTGSLNWTISGLFGNDENVLITSNKRTVASYLAEFETIWHLSEYELQKDSSWSDMWVRARNKFRQ